jgi:hypothetical protein
MPIVNAICRGGILLPFRPSVKSKAIPGQNQRKPRQHRPQ